jgi:hypothetical protein
VSPGEWQRICGKSSLFINVASQAISSETILGLSSASSARALILLDRFNTFKRYNRQATGQEEPLAALLTMTGNCSVIVNNWSVEPLTALKTTHFLTEKIATNQPIGLALYNYKQQEELPDLLKLNFVQYGVPLLKLA